MSKDSTLSILRTLLMAVAAFLIGKNLFGNAIDASIAEQLGGAFLAIVTLIWSFVDKTSTLEGFQSTVKGFIVFGGGLAIAAGKLRQEALEVILGLLSILGPMLYSYLSRLKTRGLSNGTIKIETLKGGS
ncbi:MAG: hypothetical protein H7320_11690 [Ferruginibacter sp.]|nr:hypothetical protein [Ferruginibacter sp.]